MSRDDEAREVEPERVTKKAKGVLDPAWTFEEAVEAASSWYTPGSRLTGPARNAAIEAWAAAVGRERAVEGMADFLRKHGSRSAAARALGMSYRTWRRFEDSFAQMPRRGEREGLTLNFNANLNRIDRYIIDGVIVSVLGRDTKCEIAEFVVEERTGTTKVRLTADTPDQLLAVALVLTDIVPDLDADLVQQRHAVQIWGKRYVADDLLGQWKSTAETLGSIELRIEPEKLEALVEQEPGYAVFQGFTSFQPSTWREKAGEMLLPVWNALLIGAKHGIPYMLMQSVDKDVRGLLGEKPDEGRKKS